MFREGGYQGTESTFGLGGPWDGAGLDGKLYQWQLLSRQADAQGPANDFATSIECSDGGDPRRGFSEKQVDALVELHVWWTRTTGRTARIAPTWKSDGWGYHSLFKEWNPNSHTCPGEVRKQQLRTVIWPRAVEILLGYEITNPPSVPAQSWPKFPLPEGGYYGLKHWAGIPNPEEGLRLWQRQMVARGWRLHVNGQFTEAVDDVVRKFQREKRLQVDGKIGRNTWNAAWTKPVT